MIFVTGANGHIGSHIVKNLLEHGYQVRAFCRPGSQRKALETILQNIEIAEGDILNPVSVEHAMRGCEGVIHTATLFSVNPSLTEVILKTAVEGSLHVAKAASLLGVKKFVYTSSTAAVGSSLNPEVLLDENSWNTQPGNVYTRAKIEAEQKLVSFAKESGLPLIRVCPSTVVGPGDFRLTPSNALLKKFIAPFTFFYFLGGTNLVFVRDIAEGHRLAYEKGKSLERYILSGTNTTFNNLTQRIDAYLGKKNMRICMPSAILLGGGRICDFLGSITGASMPASYKALKTHLGYYYYFSNCKAHEQLGFTPSTLEQFLPETLAWIMKTTAKRR